MIKSLHIGRYATKAEDFRQLVKFFEAIGFDRIAPAPATKNSAILSAPLALLSVNALSPQYPPEVLGRLKDVAKLIVLEVTNPDDVFAIATAMGFRVLADSSLPESGERSFSLELPGEIVVTVHGQPAEEESAVEGKLDASGKSFSLV